MDLIIFVTIFCVPLLSKHFRNNNGLLFLYIVVIALHQIVAITNAFFFVTPGADLDAKRFLYNATEIASAGVFEFGIDAIFYDNALGLVFFIFGPSEFLGSQFSILAFALSCVVLIWLLKEVGWIGYDKFCLFIYGALPTSVMLNSITLRESYQTLFFMVAVYSGLRMCSSGHKLFYFSVLVISSILMGLFHKALVLFVPFLIFIPVVFLVFTSNKKSLIPASLFNRRVLRYFLVSLVLFLTVSVVFSGFFDDFFSLVSAYREGAEEGRASYGGELEFGSPILAIVSIVTLYLHYMLSPFPWNVYSAFDAYAFLESFLRFLLLAFAIKGWRNSFGNNSNVHELLFILFFAMTFMWALGTSNYGTAIRHHLSTNWIIVILGGPALWRFVIVLLRSSVIGYKLPSEIKNRD